MGSKVYVETRAFVVEPNVDGLFQQGCFPWSLGKQASSSDIGEFPIVQGWIVVRNKRTKSMAAGRASPLGRVDQGAQR
jgi:hypothetical protein